MNTTKIIIHGIGTMGTILKNIVEKDDSLELAGFADNLTNEKGDVIVDFSHFSLIENMLDYGVKNNIPIVICTTGYDDKILEKINEASKNIPIVLASNTSIGVTLMNEIVSKVASVLNDFDIEIVETHHNKKIDSPSGTAKSGTHKREKKEIGMHSLRGGSVVGEHSVIFYGDDEAIEITHKAMSKKIFAHGAIKAAKFLVGKSPKLYNMKEVLS